VEKERGNAPRLAETMRIGHVRGYGVRCPSHTWYPPDSWKPKTARLERIAPEEAAFRATLKPQGTYDLLLQQLQRQSD
jgi:hypothetical protein